MGMRRAGEVTYANAHNEKRNEGVVEFASRTDMDRAVEKYDGYEVHGRKLELTTPREASRSRSRSRSKSRGRSKSRSRSRDRRRSRSKSRSRSRSRDRKRSEKDEEGLDRDLNPGLRSVAEVVTDQIQNQDHVQDLARNPLAGKKIRLTTRIHPITIMNHNRKRKWNMR